MFRETKKIHGLKEKNILMNMVINVLHSVRLSIFESLKDCQFDNHYENNHLVKFMKTVTITYLNIIIHHVISMHYEDYFISYIKIDKTHSF